MKNKFFGLSIFLFALSLGFVSCDVEPIDSGLEPSDFNPTQVMFAANYAGNNYSTNQASAEVANGQLKIVATNSTGTFTIQSIGAVIGTYTNSQLEFTYYEYESGITFSSIHPDSQVSNSQLNIQSINFQQQSITGTFQFVGYAPVVINDTVTIQEVVFSQGTFLNIPYANGITNPGQPGGGGTSSGDYFPMAVGNTWNYTHDASLVLGSSQVINGKTYFKETNSFFTGAAEWPDLEEFVAKQNGNYYVAVKSAPGAEHPIETQEIIILKDNLNVGGTWNSSMVLTHTDEEGGISVITINTDYVIQEKGISMTVNGVNYENVIKVKSVGTSEFTYNGEPFGDEPEVSSEEMWFAKDIGIIKLKSVMVDEPDEIYDLVDYELN